MKNHSIIMRATTLFPSKLGVLAAAILVTVAFALLVGPFSGQAVAGGGGPHAFAVGGFIAMDTSQVAFAAQFNPHTGSYAGHVVQTDMSGVSRHGPVTCVATDGTATMAVVVWTVTKSDNPADVGQTRSFEVTDGGEPPTGMDMYKDRGTDTSCSFDMTGTYVPVVRGNIVVKQTGP